MMNEQADFKRTLSIFVDHMRDRRRVLGITQEQLSERSGLSHNYLAKIEIGLKTPSLKTVIRIAKALEMEVSDKPVEENSGMTRLKKDVLYEILESLAIDANPVPFLTVLEAAEVREVVSSAWELLYIIGLLSAQGMAFPEGDWEDPAQIRVRVAGSRSEG